MVPNALTPIDIQIFAQLPVVTLFGVIVLKMLTGFKQYLKERDDAQTKTTDALTKVIADMSKQVNFLAVSLAENRAIRRDAHNNAVSMGD